jgi:hypothetical protein
MMRADTVTSKPEDHASPMDAATSRLMETPETLGLHATPTGRVSHDPGFPPRGDRLYRTPSHRPVRHIGVGREPSAR